MSTLAYQYIGTSKKILLLKVTLTISLFILAFTANSQVKYDSIHVYNYRTNYPKSAFLCDSVLCDTLPCDGKCFSTYEDGQFHYQGTFKNGQPIDTFKVFYTNGNLKELYIPNIFHRFYNHDGDVIYQWNHKRKEEHSFYKKRRIKRFAKWSRNKPIVIKEYYPNGGLKSETKHNHKKIYDRDGLLASDITRKEVWALDRVVNGNAKWYEYHHVEYDNCNRKLRESQYKKAFIEHDAFPDSIDEIREYNMSYFYNFSHGKMFKKQTWIYQQHKGKYQKLHRTFLLVNNAWEEQIDPDLK